MTTKQGAKGWTRVVRDRRGDLIKSVRADWKLLMVLMFR